MLFLVPQEQSWDKGLKKKINLSEKEYATENNLKHLFSQWICYFVWVYI